MDKHRGRWIVSVVVVGMASLGAAILFAFDPASHGFYPTCLFHSATGLLCPGCGSLRALHQLLHGHIAAAFRYNPLLVLSLPLGIWFSARLAMSTLEHQPAFSLKWVWVYVGVGLVFGILRNLPVGPFVLLRP